MNFWDFSTFRKKIFLSPKVCNIIEIWYGKLDRNKFTKSEFKTLESQLPLFIEFGKVHSAHCLDSKIFAEFEISGIVSNALKNYYKNKLDNQAREFCDYFIWALSEKFTLLRSLPFALSVEFKALVKLLDDGKVVDQKQPIIDEILSVLDGSVQWNNHVLVGLDQPLKNIIIEKKNEIEKRYKEKFKFNNVDRLWDYYVDLFKSWKKDFPVTEKMGQVEFRKFSKELMEFLLYRYLRQAKSLSELCSNFPYLRDPVTVLENKLSERGVFHSYFEEMYETQLENLRKCIGGKQETLETVHSALISKAEEIMLKAFGFPKPGSSSKGSSSEKPGTGDSSSPSGMEMEKILGITFTVVAVVLAVCGVVFFLRQRRSKALVQP